jgi:hypothetical protein
MLGSQPSTLSTRTVVAESRCREEEAEVRRRRLETSQHRDHVIIPPFAHNLYLVIFKYGPSTTRSPSIYLDRLKFSPDWRQPDILDSISARLESVTLARDEEVDELEDDGVASVRTSETLDTDAERSESSSESDSLHSSSLEDAESLDEPDDSLAQDDEEYDELEEEEEEEDDEDEDEEDGEASVDLEWEEAQEMVGAAVSSHTRALKVAATEGLFVTKRKTVVNVVEVVRAIVNLIGPFNVRPYPITSSFYAAAHHPLQEGPVTAQVILEQLRVNSRVLVDDSKRFVFEDGQSLLNKYLAMVKYAYPEGVDDDSILDEALNDEDVYTEEGKISIKALVRRLKYALEVKA